MCFNYAAYAVFRQPPQRECRPRCPASGTGRHMAGGLCGVDSVQPNMNDPHTTSSLLFDLRLTTTSPTVPTHANLVTQLQPTTKSKQKSAFFFYFWF